MDDLRQRVIRGLECCSEGTCARERCPYHHKLLEDWKQFDCNTELSMDALALLKSQQARIAELEAAHTARLMTLEELKGAVDSPCWFESHGTYMGKEGFWIIPDMFTAQNIMRYVFSLRGDNHCSELGLHAYNSAWRCWTSRPTDEQREAVKWE